MAARTVVHVIGTGTIGEPLIGMLARQRGALGIDEVTFQKRSPLITDRSKVIALMKHGASLAVDGGRVKDFAELGMKARYTSEEALDRAAVIIDCTPVGNRNKAEIYEPLAGTGKGFIAQGSERGFGKPYALDVNDSALVPGEDRFIQVVSCNTHNICALLKALAVDGDVGGRSNLEEGRFLCVRRASDISQEGSFIAAPKVGTHGVERHGTHHARDAHEVFETLGHDLRLFSSAMQISTQYMHTLYFSIRMREALEAAEVERRLRAAPRVAVSQKTTAGQVFSFGRDHGIHGRLIDHTVVPLPPLTMRDGGREVIGFAFTPPDGNSLMSSMAATCWLLDPDTYLKRLAVFEPFSFPEI